MGSEVKSVLYDTGLAKGAARFRLTVFLLKDGKAVALAQRGKASEDASPEFRAAQFSYLTAVGKYSDAVEFLSPGQARYAFGQVRQRIIHKGYEAKFADLEARPAEEPEMVVPDGVRADVCVTGRYASGAGGSARGGRMAYGQPSGGLVEGQEAGEVARRWSEVRAVRRQGSVQRCEERVFCFSRGLAVAALRDHRERSET